MATHDARKCVSQWLVSMMIASLVALPPFVQPTCAVSLAVRSGTKGPSPSTPFVARWRYASTAAVIRGSSTLWRAVSPLASSNTGSSKQRKLA